MTDTELDVETLAQRIAARGRDALVERLRVAYSDAAAVHADIISLDDERIETLVQSAANRADGLQWRRALAGVAAEELDVTIPEALSHPAVARAQTLVGAPSYEQSLAELIARPVPPASTNGGEPTGAPAGAPDPCHGGPARWPARARGRAGARAASRRSRPSRRAEPCSRPAERAGGGTRTGARGRGAGGGTRTGPRPRGWRRSRRTTRSSICCPSPTRSSYETQLYETQPQYTDQDSPPTLEPEPFAEETDGRMGPRWRSRSCGGTIRGRDPPRDRTRRNPPRGRHLRSMETRRGGGPPWESLQVTAVHLGGVANLPTKREGLGLRLSADGLDILQGEGEIIGRLIWDEIEALEVPHLRARRRPSAELRGAPGGAHPARRRELRDPRVSRRRTTRPNRAADRPLRAPLSPGARAARA